MFTKIKMMIIEKQMERNRRNQVKKMLTCFDKVKLQGRKGVF